MLEGIPFQMRSFQLNRLRMELYGLRWSTSNFKARRKKEIKECKLQGPLHGRLFAAYLLLLLPEHRENKVVVSPRKATYL